MEPFIHRCSMIGCVRVIGYDERRPAAVWHWIPRYKEAFMWCDRCAKEFPLEYRRRTWTRDLMLPLWQPYVVTADQLLALEMLCHSLSRLPWPA